MGVSWIRLFFGVTGELRLRPRMLGYGEGVLVRKVPSE
jgi:hypothetical protein